MFCEHPRAFGSPEAVAERRGLSLTSGSVQPLRAWREELLGQRPGALVPEFDPAEAGVRARALFVAKAPGPGALDPGDGGSGFVSVDNDDHGAEAMWVLRSEAGLGEDDVAHWNVVPWCLPTASATPTAADLLAGTRTLKTLLPLLPRLEVLVLAGTHAQRGWKSYVAQPPASLTVLEMPLPDKRVMSVPEKAALARKVVARVRTSLGVPRT